jgi:steroid delta-isomerase-like uncharacterized protein
MRLFKFSFVACGLAGAMLLLGAADISGHSAPRGEELARKVCEVWSFHKAGAVDELFAEDGVYEDVASGNRFEGREAIKGFLNQNFVAVPDFKVEVTQVFSTGGMVTCEWIMSGTQTGDYPDLPATGKHFSVRGASVAEVQGGRIVRWTDYYDMFTFLQQLGVVPTPGSPQQQ